MYPEFMRAEYSQKRRTRPQWVDKTGMFIFVGVQVLGFSAFVYVVFFS